MEKSNSRTFKTFGDLCEPWLRMNNISDAIVNTIEDMWIVLRMNNISDARVNTIEDVCKKAKCEVSRAFKTKVGLLQGCLLSPIEVYVLYRV